MQWRSGWANIDQPFAPRVRLIGFLKCNGLTLHRARKHQGELHGQNGLDTARPCNRSCRIQRQVSFEQARVERADGLQPEAFEGQHGKHLVGCHARLKTDVDQMVTNSSIPWARLADCADANGLTTSVESATRTGSRAGHRHADMRTSWILGL